MNFSRDLLGFALRGLSAVSKLAFIYYLAKKTDESNLGNFALIATAVAAFSQLAGLELNQVNGRTFHELRYIEAIKRIKHQFIIHAATYAVVLPVIFFWLFDDLPYSAIIVSFLFVFEHIGVEIYRLSITYLKPMQGALLMFLRNFCWVFTYILLIEFNVIKYSLDSVLITWLMFSSLSVLFFIFLNSSHLKIALNAKITIFSKSSYKIVREAAPYALTALVLTASTSIDKLIVSQVLGHSALGIFFFYLSVASALSLLVSFTVGSYRGPVCIKAYATHGAEAYYIQREILISSYRQIIIYGFLFLSLFIWPLIYLLNKVSYFENVLVFYILLASVSVLSYSEVFKLDLFLSKKDNRIFLFYFVYVAFMSLSLVSLSYAFGINGAAFALLASSILLCVLMRGASIRIRTEKIDSF